MGQSGLSIPPRGFESPTGYQKWSRRVEPEFDCHFLMNEDGSYRRATLEEWCTEGGLRQVAYDEDMEHYVSTIFLGISWHDPPLVFETMVFTQGGESREQMRYATIQEALTGHDAFKRQYRIGEEK